MSLLIANSEAGSSVRDKINRLYISAVNPQTNDYTLVLGDAFTQVEMNKATVLNLTIPPNSAVAFDIGTVILVKRTGAGILTVVQGAGVTVTGSSGALADAGLNVTMRLKKTGTDTWDLQNGAPGAWLTYTPAFTGFSADPTSITARYSLIGKTCTVHIAIGATGTSNAATFTITLPFAAANTATQVFPILTVNSGTAANGKLVTRVNSNIADLFNSIGSAAFTTSGAKAAQFNITYEIA